MLCGLNELEEVSPSEVRCHNNTTRPEETLRGVTHRGEVSNILWSPGALKSVTVIGDLSCITRSKGA